MHSLILRTVLGAANLILGFKAVIILDVHLVMILGTITPFVSMYLSSIMLGEKVRLITVLISLFCAFGILLIVDPSVIFKADEGKNHDSGYFLGIILMIVSTCIRALSGIILKKGRINSRRFRRQFMQFLFRLRTSDLFGDAGDYRGSIACFFI